MNRNRKKTVIPLEDQLEIFFTKVLKLNYEFTKKIDNNAKPLDIKNLDRKTLIYEGMKAYEELIKVFKINSEKKIEKNKNRYRNSIRKNMTDTLNYKTKNSLEINNKNEYNNNEDNDGYNEENNNLDDTRTSRRRGLGYSYDKGINYFKYNRNNKEEDKYDDNYYKENKDNKYKRSNIFNKSKYNQYSKYGKDDKYDNKSKYDKNNKYDDNDDDYDDYNDNKNKFNNYETYENKVEYNKPENSEEINNNDENDQYNNKRNDKKDKYVHFDNYDNSENYDDNDNYEKNENNDNKENYNKFNLFGSYNKIEISNNSNKKKIIEQFNSKRKSLNNNELRYNTYRRNITNEKDLKNSINTQTRENTSHKGRYKYKYIGNKDNTITDMPDNKQNRWMKKKTNINNSIISRSRNLEYEESQEISRNTWLKKRQPLVQDRNLGNNKIVNNINNLKRNLNNKLLYNNNNNVDNNEIEMNYDENFHKNNYLNTTEIMRLNKNNDNNENNNENIKENNNVLTTKKIGNDIYNINYGKIVNKNMYINVYKGEPKDNFEFYENKKFIDNNVNDENDDIYNYNHNNYNIYQEEEGNFEKFGMKLVGKEMLKKSIRDKEEKERLSNKFKNVLK